MAVASVENDGVTNYCVTVEGRMFFYNDTKWAQDDFYTLAGPHEYVFIDGYGYAEDWAAVGDALQGKIALCSRGSADGSNHQFYQKAETALRELSTPVTDEEGNVLYYTGISGGMGSESADSEYMTMSVSSSWGVPGSLELKPDITAPGGNILSVWGEITHREGYSYGGFDKYILNSGTATVAANGSATVTVTVRMTELTKSRLDAEFDNGTYVQGYVYAKSLSSEEGVMGTTHSIPVLGFYGSWTDASVYEVGTVAERATGEENRMPYTGVTETNAFTVEYDARSGREYWFGGNPVVGDEQYLSERNAINSENGDAVKRVLVTPIRDAAALRYTVTNVADGEVLRQSEMGPVALYNTSGNTVFAAAGVKTDIEPGVSTEYVVDRETWGYESLPAYASANELFIAATIVEHTVLAATDTGLLYATPESDLTNMTLVADLGTLITAMAYNRADGLVYGVDELSRLVAIDKLTASCVIRVERAAVTLEGLLQDEDRQSQRFDWNVERGAAWEGGVELDFNMTSATVDALTGKAYVMDSAEGEWNMHLVDLTTGKTEQQGVNTMGVPMWDMTYSTQFFTQGAPVVHAVYSYYLMPGKNPMSWDGTAFTMTDLFEQYTGASYLVAIASRGAAQIDKDGVLTDAEQVQMLDDAGYLWDYHLYQEEGAYKASVGLAATDLEIEFPGDSSMMNMYTSMVVGEDGDLYLSAFTDESNIIYRLRAADDGRKAVVVVSELLSVEQTEVLTQEAPDARTAAFRGESAAPSSDAEVETGEETVTVSVTADTDAVNGLAEVSYDTEHLLLEQVTVCGETETEVIPMPGHSYVTETVVPTCTEKGYTAYTCAACGNYHVADFVDPACASAHFTDVALEDWFHDAVEYVVDNGLMCYCTMD